MDKPLCQDVRRKMLLTLVTFALLLPAYFASRYVVRAASPKSAVAVVIGLAVLSALLMPRGARVPPWMLAPANHLELALYLVSELTFFTMAGVAVFLAQRMRGGGA
jgi:hypothetical protein